MNACNLGMMILNETFIITFAWERLRRKEDKVESRGNSEQNFCTINSELK